MADSGFLDKRIVKAFRHVALTDLPDSPVHALKGVSDGDADLLYKSFYVRTIRDLADLKYVHWAQELVALANVPQSKIDMGAFRDKLIKKYEQTPVKELLRSPIDVLQGVSKADAKRIREAFYVKTVRDLARLKYVRWAQEVVSEAYGELSEPLRTPLPSADEPAAEDRAPARGRDRFADWKRALWILLVILLLLLLGWALWRGCNSGDSSSETQNQAGAGQRQSEESDAGDANGSADEAANGAAEDEIRPYNEGDAVPANMQVYEVQVGDTLYSISRRVYGEGQRWERILRENDASIRRPDRIFPGQKLLIPAPRNSGTQ